MQESLLAASVFVLLVLLFSPENSAAFQAAGVPTSSGRTATTRLRNTGGWGIGPQRELTPEEFAKGGGNRRAFEGYQLRDRGEFMRKVAQDKQDLERGELDELLAVARQAGIAVKDPKERLNKFELDDDDENDDDLDLSVRWEDEEGGASASSPSGKRKTTDADSITRLDEDTGASGVW